MRAGTFVSMHSAAGIEREAEDIDHQSYRSKKASDIRWPLLYLIIEVLGGLRFKGPRKNTHCQAWHIIDSLRLILARHTGRSEAASGTRCQ
jgi:hypothetical protein